MIIKLLLIGVLILCAGYGFLGSEHSRLVRWPIILTSLIGIYFVLQPEKTTVIAAALGVGRGADLLLYCWFITTLTLIIRLRLVQLQQHREITALARELAIAGAALQKAPDARCP